MQWTGRLQPLLLGRLRELTLVVVGAVIGIASGLVVSGMGLLTEELHSLLFGIALTERLSEQRTLQHPGMIVVPCVGGLLIGASLWLMRRWQMRLPVDPIEANALHGGRMAIRESVLVAAQTVVSSGFGASVGLEAGYTQASASLASRLALALGLRRSEVRMLVGCGAAGAISAAFNAPITGAFYAFELIIGTYSVQLIAPVMAAAVIARLTTYVVGIDHIPIDIGPVSEIAAIQLPAYILLGIVGGLAAVITMRLVNVVETVFKRLACPIALRPVIGGLIVGVLGYISPQVLSSGHGALHLELALSLPWMWLIFLFCLKALAAALSLGTGFRGGLFFSSLFLGSLVGKIFAGGLPAFGAWPGVPEMVAAVVGMAAMAVGAVGGPLTMTFLAIESTGNLSIGIAVLLAAIASAITVRETFGYSFSTWRLHLRGETIRSAHDIGRMRSLTVGGLMRTNVKTIAANASLTAFCAAFPLGSGQRVIALDATGCYAGIIIVADAHAVLHDVACPADAGLGDLITLANDMLDPTMLAEDAARRFQATHSEELVVVDSSTRRHVLGLVTEQHLLRRFAEELEKARRDLAGSD
jgi:CIC family chloride channel protein